MMTREQKLHSMRMPELIIEAERIGVKIDKKGAKDKAVAKILAFEAEQAQAVAETAEAEVAEEQITDDTTCGDGTPFTEVMQVAGAEQRAEKKVRKARQPKRTFETLLADIPMVANIQLLPNSKRTAVHVKRGSKRIFGYSGPVLVVNRKEYLQGVEYEARDYGYVVAPTRENMLKILANA